MRTPPVRLQAIRNGALNFIGGGLLDDSLIHALLEVADNAWDKGSKEKDVKERRAEFVVFAVRGVVHDIVRCKLADSDLLVLA